MMRCASLTIAAIGLAAFSFSAPAAAQDGSEASSPRTIEGAQQFLGEFYERGNARAETAGYVSGNTWSWDEVPGARRQMIEGKVTGLRSAGRCRSVATIFAPIKKKWRNSDPVVPVVADGSGVELEIDWSKLDKVKVQPGWMYEEGGPRQIPSGWTEVLVYWPNGYIFLNHWDSADAERAGFAIQFLKEECGLKSDTGF